MAMIKGMYKTLMRPKCKIQHEIMLKNRKSYPHTAAMQRNWRSNRNVHDPLSLFIDFDVHPDEHSIQEIYTMFRDYLIVELKLRKNSAQV